MAENVGDRGGFPWYVKVALGVVVLIMLYVVVIDVLELAGAI